MLGDCDVIFPRGAVVVVALAAITVVTEVGFVGLGRRLWGVRVGFHGGLLWGMEDIFSGFRPHTAPLPQRAAHWREGGAVRGARRGGRGEEGAERRARRGAV